HNGKPSAPRRSPRAPRVAGEARRLGTPAALLFAVLVVADPHGAQAGINVWTSHGPPGPVSALAVDPRRPGTLYAGTYGAGVFKSIDGGGTWSATGLTNAKVGDAIVVAFAIDPTTSTTLYARTARGGAFKSTDGGRTWDAVLPGVAVRALAFD